MLVGYAQPHAWAAPFGIDEFHPRLFQGTADRLIIGSRQHGRARLEFGAADGGDTHR